MVANEDTKAGVGSGVLTAPLPTPAAETLAAGPAVAASGPAASAGRGSASTGDESRDDADPMAWQVPVVCKDCSQGFEVPYRHFQAGVVFHCPHCHGSFVPTSTMYRSVHAAFETFFARRRATRAEAALTEGGEQAWRDRERRELKEFHAALGRIALAMRPAGKMVRKGWLASMFS